MILTNTDCVNAARVTARRGFLRTGTMGLVLAALWLEGDIVAFGQQRPTAEPAAPIQRGTGLLTRSKFKAHLSEYFSASLNGEDVHLQLYKIGDLTQGNAATRTKLEAPGFQAKFQEECFSLLFRSSSETLLPQKTWTLRNDALGSIEIFLVPVDRADGPWHYYEAIFNRLQK